MQTGVNHLDFVSYYSPIANDANGAVSVAPEYYGMLAFAQGGRGERVALDCDAGGVNLTAYAAVDEREQLAVTLINKDRTTGAEVAIAADRAVQRATALRLKGRALDSADNVTFGGSTVTADGHWQPANVEAQNVAGGVCTIQVPASSAAVVTWTA
jgi:Glycosyl hydrolase family 79 C-terminal beta domain